ncbi:MAG: YeeE/YedE family protein [Acidimicrobiales bacterium]|nr:YeeE/YedE family protein [Acidimicrobiales bacterium]
MFDVLPDRVPWFIVGPSLGLLIVLFFLTMNQPLGASGSYVHSLKLLQRKTDVVVWRVWYFAGIFLGGVVVTQVLRDTAHFRTGYDAVRNLIPSGLTVVFVFVGAVIMGYGAKVAGGCTSGHGLCGTSQRSYASIVSTGTFMSTAIATTLLLRLITGGDL